MKKSILPVIPVFVLTALLVFPALSFEGAKNGLLLWFNIVLPTLLPFMICSGLIVAWNGVGYLTRPLSPFFSMLGLNEAGSYALICGLLCGYPMGAKTAADFVRNKTLTKKEGNRLLAIAGCPSPMFLAGYIKMNLPPGFPFWHAVLALYAPILLFAVLTKKKALGSEQKTKAPPSKPLKTFDEILMDSFEIMVKIGGYIMLFSILSMYAGYLFLKDSFLKPLLLGAIEMTTGIQAVSASMDGVTAAAAIISAAAFGGLCGIFQTKTVIKNAGLSIRHYVLWKLLHASLTGILIILLSYL